MLIMIQLIKIREISMEPLSSSKEIVNYSSSPEQLLHAIEEQFAKEKNPPFFAQCIWGRDWKANPVDPLEECRKLIMKALLGVHYDNCICYGKMEWWFSYFTRKPNFFYPKIFPSATLPLSDYVQFGLAAADRLFLNFMAAYLPEKEEEFCTEKAEVTQEDCIRLREKADQWRAVLKAAPPKTNRLKVGAYLFTALPPEIGCFKELVKLRVDVVRYPFFPLPTQLYELPKLTSFSATVLPDLKRLKQLQRLKLEHIPLNEIPNELFEMTSLKKLAIRYTQISEIPDRVEKLTDLEKLDIVYNCELSYLSDALDRLPHLRVIRCCSNNVPLLAQVVTESCAMRILQLASTNVSYEVANGQEFAKILKPFVRPKERIA